MFHHQENTRKVSFWHKCSSHSTENGHRRKSFENKIKTSKYTWWNFLPWNIYQQMHRYANIYFLFIAVLNFVPVVNAVNKWVGMTPLIIVLVATALKDGYEDFRRHLADRRINNRKCLIYCTNQHDFIKKTWKELQVGDIVHVSCDEVVPADLLLLRSSGSQHMGYVDMSALDGESNLKQIQVVPNIPRNPSVCTSSCSCQIALCDLPDKEIYKFYGTLHYKEQPSDKVKLSISNVLLRGSVLRNTESVEGIVVYAGHDSKIVLNSLTPRFKRSNLELRMNRDVIVCSLILFILCLSSSFGAAIFQSHFSSPGLLVPFIAYESSKMFKPLYLGFVRFWRFIILYQELIPTALYLSMEPVKMMQVLFIHWDINLFDDEKNKSAKCRALNITEDLGQIEYLLTDKTGTLTENQMVFKKCLIGTTSYEVQKTVSEKQQETDMTDAAEAMLNQDDRKMLCSNEQRNEDHLLGMESLDGSDEHSCELHLPKHDPFVINFLVAMAICNTVSVVENESQGEVRYEGESPDEVALVNAASSNGCVLKSRSNDQIIVDLPDINSQMMFSLLQINHFDSFRKRQSVIVQNKLTGETKLYCKGADSAIFSQLQPGQDDLLEFTSSTVRGLACEGLRILCFAEKTIPIETYEKWEHQLSSGDSVSVHGDVRKLITENMESELLLLGATGIEDKLQIHVPETVSALKEAGIKIWMLTGDKQETAISTAFACGLVKKNKDFLLLNTESQEEMKNRLEELNHESSTFENFALHDLDVHSSNPAQEAVGEHSVRYPAATSQRTATSQLTATSYDSISQKSLVIDGTSLNYILKSDLEQCFMKVAESCSSVICVRATPFQKAALVSLVKRHQEKRTLAIGDGGNDVSMLQTADVGVGISGHEGMQAVMAADFALPRFHFLRRMLLLHGHWCYDRLSRLVLYIWYKNIMFELVIFWMQFFSGFTGGYPYNDYGLLFFNRLYTSVVPVFFGIWEQHIPADVLLTHPSLYQIGRNNKIYKRCSILSVMLAALYESLVAFFIPYFAYSGGASSLWEFGVTVYTGVVWAQHAHIGLQIHCWNILQVTAMLISLTFYYSVSLILSFICTQCSKPAETYKVFTVTLATPEHWFCIVLVTVLSLLPSLTVQVLRAAPSIKSKV